MLANYTCATNACTCTYTILSGMSELCGLAPTHVCVRVCACQCVGVQMCMSAAIYTACRSMCSKMTCVYMCVCTSVKRAYNSCTREPCHFLQVCVRRLSALSSMQSKICMNDMSRMHGFFVPPFFFTMCDLRAIFVRSSSNFTSAFSCCIG